MSDLDKKSPDVPKKNLSPAAKRALDEAAERRETRETAAALKPEKKVSNPRAMAIGNAAG